MQTERLHALDAVRGGALLMGVFFHAAMPYIPGNFFWFSMDPSRHEAFSYIFYVLHIFRMTVFFLLAGFFGRMMYHRRGAGGFIKDRLKRIGIPLVLGWPLVWVSIVAVIIWGAWVQNGGAFPEDSPPPPPMTVDTFPLTHLWFLYSLLMFYAGMLILRTPVAFLDRGHRLRGVWDKVMSLIFRTPIGLLVVALPAFLVFAVSDQWMMWFGVPAADYGLKSNRFVLVAYGFAFAMGWWMQRQLPLIANLAKQWWVYMVIAVGATVYCVNDIGMVDTYFTTSSLTTEKGLYSAAYALAMWAWTFGLIGMATALWSGHSAIRRYIADASYWVYIIHLPIVMALQVLVFPWDWSAPAKYAFVMGTSLPVMFLSYHVLVRYSFIGGILNGARKSK